MPASDSVREDAQRHLLQGLIERSDVGHASLQRRVYLADTRVCQALRCTLSEQDKTPFPGEPTEILYDAYLRIFRAEKTGREPWEVTY